MSFCEYKLKKCVSFDLNETLQQKNKSENKTKQNKPWGNSTCKSTRPDRINASSSWSTKFVVKINTCPSGLPTPSKPFNKPLKVNGQSACFFVRSLPNNASISSKTITEPAGAFYVCVCVC